MRAFFLMALLMTGVSSFASTEEVPQWQMDLDQYQSEMAARSNLSLSLSLARYAGEVVVACGSSFAVATSSFVTDTLPVTNIVSETIANMADGNYQSQDYDSILSLEALAELGRGTSGGAVVGVAEVVEFLVLVLAGEEKDRGFEALKKVYASSFATLDKLFADKGRCMMGISKVVMLTGELSVRMNSNSNMSFADEGMVTP